MKRKIQKHLIDFTFYICLKNSLSKKFHGCFLTHIRTARFVVPLIVFGNWKFFAGLQIHPKKILMRTNKAEDT